MCTLYVSRKSVRHVLICGVPLQLGRIWLCEHMCGCLSRQPETNSERFGNFSQGLEV